MKSSPSVFSDFSESCSVVASSLEFWQYFRNKFCCFVATLTLDTYFPATMGSNEQIRVDSCRGQYWFVWHCPCVLAGLEVLWFLPQVFNNIPQVYGRPKVDLFLTRRNHKLSLYVSSFTDPLAWKKNAFQHPQDYQDIHISPIAMICGDINQVTLHSASQWS